MTNQAFSRVLINNELVFSRWNLLNPKTERFEFSGQIGLAGFGYIPFPMRKIRHTFESLKRTAGWWAECQWRKAEGRTLSAEKRTSQNP